MEQQVSKKRVKRDFLNVKPPPSQLSANTRSSGAVTQNWMNSGQTPPQYGANGVIDTTDDRNPQRLYADNPRNKAVFLSLHQQRQQQSRPRYDPPSATDYDDYYPSLDNKIGNPFSHANGRGSSYYRRHRYGIPNDPYWNDMWYLVSALT